MRGDEGPLLNVRILANLGDAVEVVSGGDRQDQCGQVAVSSNGHLKESMKGDANALPHQTLDEIPIILPQVISWAYARGDVPDEKSLSDFRIHT